MEMKSHCHDIQAALSDAIDRGDPPPAPLLEHAADCQDCAAFLAAWSGDLDDVLAAPLPPAGLELRQRILALPAASRRSEGTRQRLRAIASAAAAAVVLGIAGYALIDVKPSGTAISSRPNVAERELAAIKSDLRRGLAALREPAGAIQRVLRP
jgi:hypothetical protein